MARTLPVLLALVVSFFSQCFAVFSNQHITGGTALLSTYVVRFAMYFLLLSMPLYLKSLRKIHYTAENVIQFTLALFLIETAIVYIWFPLENSVLCIIPVTSKFLNTYLPKISFLHNLLWYNINVTHNNVVLLSTSYFLSFLILCCVMHATRAVDFRLIRVLGIFVFVQDAWRRFRNGMGKLIPFYKRRYRRGSDCSSLYSNRSMRGRKSSRSRRRHN